MNTQDNIANAQDPDLRASLAAMRRAARLARQTAMQTDTGIVIVQDGEVVRISAQELRENDKQSLHGGLSSYANPELMSQEQDQNSTGLIVPTLQRGNAATDAPAS